MHAQGADIMRDAMPASARVDGRCQSIAARAAPSAIAPPRSLRYLNAQALFAAGAPLYAAGATSASERPRATRYCRR